MIPLVGPKAKHSNIVQFHKQKNIQVEKEAKDSKSPEF